MALSLVLFALTFRTILPLGLVVVADKDGVPLVICQQIANIQQNLSSDDDQAPGDPAPTHKCAFCMVLNADQAPLLTFSSHDLKPDFSHSVAVIFPGTVDPGHTRQVPQDNLGRDPPSA